MHGMKPQGFLRWSGVAIATVLMLLTSSLVLYPTLTDDNILIALRLTSVTTAFPFLLLFVAQPLATRSYEVRQWLDRDRQNLWHILSISHFIHLYQISLYYQLGHSCSLTVWLVTSPLWIVMAIVSGIELIRPDLMNRFYQGQAPKSFALLYRIGVWYIWFVFTLAFGLGTMGKHLLFYNVPALILFLAGAAVYAIALWRKWRTS
ncbi:hypothetical protein [Roseofilum casamattae]|uniref:Ferric oxidoreductase domain-containing protein n=1 Tax=Roseofilum casamattae BLCC-M143 TaxID=3022442 RepID=A0ABT7BUR2_9CYAN|nr:hypothetical protein [Roseofilum casamattae]MDJ1182927.1 hypothetical protein [Roseofilum casamattae BLCC-M143]